MTLSTNKTAHQRQVRVGVGVLVKDPLQPWKVFCGVRTGSHGAGSLALPGGHLEMMESWEDCAKREVKEEMDIDIINVKYAHVTNDIMMGESKHYVTIFMIGEFADPLVCQTNREPGKCEGWDSFSWNQLLEIKEKGTPKLFGPLGQLIEDNPAVVLDFLSPIPVSSSP